MKRGLNIRAWVEAMRLRTLPVSAAGVVGACGLTVYYHSFRWQPALICFAFAIVAQIASNFANEYFDFKNNLDKKGRDGFRRGVTEGDINPGSMRLATFALLVFDCLLGCALIPYGGWILIPFGVLIALFALGYSTGPYPLSHNGLGDLAVIIFFGVVPVMLTVYVQTESWIMWPITLPYSLGIGMLAANVLIVNNYRDMDDDKTVGKKTTVVIFGRKLMSGIYLFFGIAGSILLTYPLLYIGDDFRAYIVIIIFSLIYFSLYKELLRRKGRELNPLLGMTAMTLLAITLTLCVIFICSK